MEPHTHYGNTSFCLEFYPLYWFSSFFSLLTHFDTTNWYPSYTTRAYLTFKDDSKISSKDMKKLYAFTCIRTLANSIGEQIMQASDLAAEPARRGA